VATTIVKIPVTELPNGKAVVVVAREVSETITARYLHGARTSGPLPSGNALVAIIRSEELSSPDEIKVSGYKRDGEKFEIVLQQQKYTGALAANVVAEALIEIELGSLRKGTYEVAVTTIAFSFNDIRHPEKAVQLGTGLQVLHFVVV
jgi:hypothetical protein